MGTSQDHSGNISGTWEDEIKTWKHLSVRHNLLVWKLIQHHHLHWKIMTVIQMTCSRLTSMYLVTLGTLSIDILQCHPMYLVSQAFLFSIVWFSKSGTYFCWRNTLCSKFQWLDGEDILIGFRVYPTSFQIGLQKICSDKEKRKGHLIQHSNFFWLWKHEVCVCLLLVVVIFFAMENLGAIVFCSMFPTYLLHIY